MIDVLIVDDERELADSIAEYLEVFDISCDVCYDADTCMSALNRNSYSLILLDVNLKAESGFLLCKEIRKSSDIPLFFITARGDEHDIIKGYGVGANDYIIKPFSLAVLYAKIRTLIKPNRSKLTLNRQAMTAKLDGKEIEFAPIEFRLLEYLYDNRGRVMDKDEIIKNVWGKGYYTDNTLNVHIKRLREKIENDSAKPLRIITIWGVGYKYAEE